MPTAIEPDPAPEPTLAELLNQAGVRVIGRAERNPPDRWAAIHADALAFTDGQTTTFCVTLVADTHCWALPV